MATVRIISMEIELLEVREEFKVLNALEDADIINRALGQVKDQEARKYLGMLVGRDRGLAKRAVEDLNNYHNRDGRGTE